jgi:tRNA(Leu) C34 or U34 (ribose-2'-O)-methylase TrmL
VCVFVCGACVRGACVRACVCGRARILLLAPQGFKLFCTSENNTTMSLHDFMRFLKETKIAGARLSAPAIVDIFSCVQVR